MGIQQRSWGTEEENNWHVTGDRGAGNCPASTARRIAISFLDAAPWMRSSTPLAKMQQLTFAYMLTRVFFFAIPNTCWRACRPSTAAIAPSDDLFLTFSN